MAKASMLFLFLTISLHCSAGMECYECEGVQKTEITSSVPEITVPPDVYDDEEVVKPPVCAPLYKGAKKKRLPLEKECPGGIQYVLCAKMEGTIVSTDGPYTTKKTLRRHYCISTTEVESWNKTLGVDVKENGECLKVPQPNPDSDVKICICNTELCNGAFASQVSAAILLLFVVAPKFLM